MDIDQIRSQSIEPVSLNEVVPASLDLEPDYTEDCSTCDGAGVVHDCHGSFCLYPEHGCDMCGTVCPECGAHK